MGREPPRRLTKNMKLVAQALALTGCCISCGSYFTKRRTLYLLLQMVTVSLYGVQYGLLGAPSGVVNDLVCFAKYLFVFLFLLHGREAPRWGGILFAACSVLLGAFAVRGVVDLVPILTALLFTYAVWQKNPYVLRGSAIACNAMWIWYNLRAGAYVSAVYSGVELVMTGVTVVRLLRAGRAASRVAPVPGAPDDASGDLPDPYAADTAEEVPQHGTGDGAEAVKNTCDDNVVTAGGAAAGAGEAAPSAPAEATKKS